MSFILNYVMEETIIEKYFNKHIEISEKKPQEEDLKMNIESIENDKYPIYYYFILIALLIIKKLLNNNFLILFKRKNNKPQNTLLSILFDKFIDYFEVLIISIPSNYKNILEKRKENNKKSKKNIEKEIKENQNENIEQYYKNILYNIKKNDFANLICLLEKYDDDIPFEISSYLTTFKNLISFLNDIENKYNNVLINSQEQKEIAKTCPICLDHYSDCHISPCGHMFCFSCIQRFTDNRCPICRINMNGVLEYPNYKFSQNNQINNQINNQHNLNNHFINNFNNNESNNRMNYIN